MYSAQRTQRGERAMGSGYRGTGQRTHGQSGESEQKRLRQGELEMDPLDETKKPAHTFRDLGHAIEHHASDQSHHRVTKQSTHSFVRHKSMLVFRRR